MLSRRGGSPIEFGRTGTLLGFFEGGLFHDESIDLIEGDTFIAYTDGVSEARRQSAFFGETGIARAMERVDDTAARLTARLLDEVLDYEGGITRDDIAVVAIHVL